MDALITGILCKINEIMQKLHYPCFELSKNTDAVFNLKNPEKEYKIKSISVMTPSVLQHVIRQKNQEEIFLMTTYVSPADGELLQQHGIPYADIAGNMFLHEDDLLILKENHIKPRIIEQKKLTGRTWTVSGLKLLFLLLTEPDALNWPYRKMVDYSGVSLGSVRYIMEDLKKNESILHVREKWLWKDFAQTAEKWSDYYIDKLLPALEKRFYSGAIPQNVQEFPLLPSGESALICRNILKSNRFLAYSFENLAPCILKNRWKQDPDGMIEIRKPFWPAIRDFADGVPLLLVYADLLAENEPRCKEAAGKIFQLFLKGNTHGRTN